MATTVIYQNEDIYHTTTKGILLSGDEDLVVGRDVTIFSRDEIAVDAPYGTRLINNGLILTPSGGSVGVAAYIVTGGRVENRPNAAIIGPSGIAVDNLFTLIDNRGLISGFAPDGKGASIWGPAKLVNHGSVHGGDRGLSVLTSRGDGVTVDNFGRISSDHAGIFFDKVAGDFLTINNKAGGMISGDDFAIQSDAGKLTVNNAGKIVGALDSNSPAQRDVVKNSGVIQGVVTLGDGNDFFKGTGGRSGAVFGEAGNDRLIGSSAGDGLVGGLGKDIQTGAGGADRFIFSDVIESAVGPLRDTITDFHHAQHDRINLSPIDANSLTVPANEAFVFIGAQGFAAYKASHPGAVGLVRFAGGVVQLTNDGDNGAEMEIALTSVSSLVAGDFIL